MAQVFEKCGYIFLNGGQKYAAAAFEKLGEGAQIAQVSFASERPQAFFHPQISLVVLQEREIARAVHISIIGGLNAQSRRCGSRRTTFIKGSTSAITCPNVGRKSAQYTRGSVVPLPAPAPDL
jgi:hypothetical protein